jgi:hypothetical protein
LFRYAVTILHIFHTFRTLARNQVGFKRLFAWIKEFLTSPELKRDFSLCSE